MILGLVLCVFPSNLQIIFWSWKIITRLRTAKDFKEQLIYKRDIIINHLCLLPGVPGNMDLLTSVHPTDHCPLWYNG